MRIVHSGVVAFSIPAVDEATCCSPSANNGYGAALPNSAAMTMIYLHGKDERQQAIADAISKRTAKELGRNVARSGTQRARKRPPAS